MLRCGNELLDHSWSPTHLAVDEYVTEAVNDIAVVDFLAEEPVSVSEYIWS
jgi:hypothetical protein